MNLRQYAAHRKKNGLRGQSHVAVLKAIQEGRLKDSARLEKSGKKQSWVIDAELADREWGENTDNYPKGTGEKFEGATALAEAAPTDAKGVPNRNVSRAIREAYLAKLAGIQYERESGTRVLKEDVQRDAFELARRVREAITNVPDRISHDLAALSDPTEVHLRLSEALRDALTELTGT